ncbi:UDP-glucose 4-epimerase [Candidatus Hepatincolaceae symbiont of Richtersius coronifer]
MKTVIVTGGAGYVGSQTCKELKKHGYNPVVFDNLAYGHEEFVKWGSFIKGDLNNFDEISQAIKKTNPIAIIHCAAYTYVAESVQDPYKYYNNNVSGSLNLFKAMIDHNIKYVIFSSTCATFGEISIPVIEENAPQNPINPYGTGKHMVEKILNDFELAYKLKSVILRYFNVAGADAEGEVGEDHTPETHLIPLIIDVALGKKEYITIFGDNYDTPDGTCIRDYIHTEDLASAHRLALEHLITYNTSEVFNLGAEKGYSVKQIINAVEKVSQVRVKTLIAEKRAGDSSVLIADSKKAKKILNWQPKYTDIVDIVGSAYKWHLKRHTTAK